MATKQEVMAELARRELARRGGQMQSATAGTTPQPDTNRKLGFPDPARPDYNDGAPWLAQAKAAFVDDPKTKAAIYAKSMFPNDPEAIKRFGTQNNEITYRDKNWNLKYAKPGGLLGSLKNFSAEQPAYIPHEVLGTMGAMTGNPLIAGMGVASGEAVRKGIGNMVFDEPQQKNDAGNLVTTGLLGGALPTFLGNQFGKLMQRGVVRDISNIDTPAFNKLDALSKSQNIPLTVAEKTNLGSLKGYQTALNNITDSADQMGTFYTGRAQSVDTAVNKMLNKLSPVDSAEDAAGMVVGATQAAKNKIADAMKQKAGPLYKSAYESGPIDINDVLSGIDSKIAKFPDTGKIPRGLRQVKRLLTDKDGNPQTNLELLDNAKREIDNLYDAAKGKPLKAEFQNAKRALLQRMDKVSPDYKAARQIWTEGSDALDKIDSTAVKVIANLPEEKWQTAAARMFNPKTTGVNAVTKAKNIIAKEDPQAWNALVRAHIESAWDDASKFSDLSKGSSFKRLIFGDNKRAAMLKAAMEPDQFKSFSDLMTVLDATGRVKQVGSDTAYKQEIIRELNDKWGAGWNSTLKPISWVKDHFSRAKIGKNAKKMADILTTQDGVESIKLIKQLKPGSQASINAISTLLGVAAQKPSGVSAPDALPEAMPPSPQ